MLIPIYYLRHLSAHGVSCLQKNMHCNLCLKIKLIKIWNRKSTSQKCVYNIQIWGFQEKKLHSFAYVCCWWWNLLLSTYCWGIKGLVCSNRILVIVTPCTRRNVRICNHPICNYMQLCVIYDYLPTSSNLGRICDYTATNVQLLFSLASYANAYIFIHE